MAWQVVESDAAVFAETGQEADTISIVFGNTAD